MQVFKVFRAKEWESFQTAGTYAGSEDDVRDGFIHMSTSVQLTGTLAKHFSGQEEIVLASIEAGQLGKALKWEVSRSGDKFPHLYAPLALSSVTSHLKVSKDGNGVFALPATFDVPETDMK